MSLSNSPSVIRVEVFTNSILSFHLGALVFPGYREHVCEGVTYILKLMLVNYHQIQRNGLKNSL